MGEMRKRISALFLSGCFVVCVNTQINATVLDFDNITNLSPCFHSFGFFGAQSYGGFAWGEIHLMDDVAFSGYHNSYDSPSGSYSVYNAFGYETVRIDGPLFDFIGANFATSAQQDVFTNNSSTSITIKGYNGSTLVDTLTMNLSANKYDWLSADIKDITSLEFLSSGYQKWWYMDDFTFNRASAPVPEPATMLLFGTGLAGLAAARRRKKKAC